MANNKTNKSYMEKRRQKNRRVQRAWRIMAVALIGVMIIFTILMGITPLLG